LSLTDFKHIGHLKLIHKGNTQEKKFNLFK